MKTITSFFAVALLLSFVAKVEAAATITVTGTGTVSQFPGSASDYSFFGKDNQFGNFGYGGGSPDTGVQSDFTLSSDVGSSYGGDNRYSTILTPAGNSSQTGILFGRAGNTNQSIVNLTLGTGSTTFNYGDFNLYVMFGNGSGDGQVRDTAISVTDGTSALNSVVADTNANLTMAQYIKFSVVGASAGDTLVIGATSPAGINYLGGVSLESAPEPSTYGLLAGGMALFSLFAFRRRLALDRLV